ncbi:MAG TPA: hypothetical protein VMV05_02305 [bacterium]|nr:hypothetical protein [bacterium]
MKIHKNNFLRDLGPTADQIQRAYQAEKAAKQTRAESEMEVKMRKVKDLMDLAAKKEAGSLDPVRDGKNPNPEGKHSGQGQREKDPAEGETSPGVGSAPMGGGHIDLRA